jgi:hypothetical protein
MPGVQFISEPLEPEAGSFDARGMARGEPGLPRQFCWRGERYEVADVLEVWKTSTPESSGGEVYVRRHWWKLRTDQGLVLTIYCDRQKKSRNAKARWWVYTVE